MNDRANWARLAAVLCLLLGLGAFFRPQWVQLRLPALAFGESGFFLQALSQPPGAKLRVNGHDFGNTPFLGNIECREQDEIVLELSAPGFRPWQRQVRCRVGQRLEIDARLQR